MGRGVRNAQPRWSASSRRRSVLAVRSPTVVRLTRTKGRAVYATKDISRGEVVICDHVLVFPDKDARARGIVHLYTASPASAISTRSCAAGGTSSWS